MAKRKLNSLEQEILIQEELTIANEINKLEMEVANNNTNVVQNNKLRFWTFFFSGIVIAAGMLFILIIIIIGDLIGLSIEFKQFLIIIGAILLLFIPIFNVIVWTCISLHIRGRNSAYIRANKVMLVRLEKYYRLLKFELDPEKYRIFDDSYVVDIDENGNLIKYVRFYNEDGFITTKPFADIRQLREFLDNNDAQEKLKADNKRLLEKANKFKEATNKFNSFNLIDNNFVSKSIIDGNNINNVRFLNDTDYFPEQYEHKVSKWYNREQYLDSAEFKRQLSKSLVDDATKNDDTVVVNASWLKGQFESKEKGSNTFFKHYDITKTMGQFKDVENFINIVRNFDLEKNPEINWEDTIDPKDFNKEKLTLFNKKIKEYEDRASQLTQEQMALEASLKQNRKKILRVALVDEVGIDTYVEDNPYKEIEKELSKQQKRANEIAKTKAIFMEYGFDDVNYDGLSIPELKRLTKLKIKEYEELKRLSKDKNLDSVVILENDIAKIKGEKFKEVHLPNEKYQNEDGLWEYYDDNGQYYVCSLDGVWNPVASAMDRFESNKEKRILKLQQKFNEEQERILQEQQRELDQKQKEIDNAKSIAIEKENKASKRKEQLKILKKESKENKAFEKQQAHEFKEKQKQKEAEYQKQFDNKDNVEIIPYVEKNPANEPFLNDDNKWMYHDGNGNYYVANENNEWKPSEPPKDKVLARAKKDNDLISPWEKEKLESGDEAINKAQLKKDKKAEKLARKEEKRNAKEASKSSTSVEEVINNDNNVVTESNATTGQAQQWQDESTGIWWYLDEQGNYYYADENGNWLPYNN